MTEGITVICIFIFSITKINEIYVEQVPFLALQSYWIPNIVFLFWNLRNFESISKTYKIA